MNENKLLILPTCAIPPSDISVSMQRSRGEDSKPLIQELVRLGAYEFHYLTQLLILQLLNDVADEGENNRASAYPSSVSFLEEFFLKLI